MLERADIEELIHSLKLTLDAHRNPAVRAQLEAWIAILTGWLSRPPSWRHAWKVLGEILSWAIGGRPTDGVIPATARMIHALGARTVFGLPLGGSTAAVGFWMGVLIAAFALLGYSCYRTATAPTLTQVAGPSCQSQPAATNLGPVGDWGIIDNQAALWQSVMAQAQKQCDAYAGMCQGECQPPLKCKPNVSVQEFDISNYGVYRSVTLKRFNCTCECLPP